MYTRKLFQGDKIAVINISDRPAKLTEVELDAGVRAIHNLGLRAEVFRESLYSEIKDIEVLELLYDIVRDDSFSGVIFASGGTQCINLVKNIDFDLLGKYPKFFMGSSDCTHLLQAITLNSNLVTYHGPVLRTIANWNSKAIDVFKKLAFSDKSVDIDMTNSAVINAGYAKGISLVGNDICNLSILNSYPKKLTSNIILFIENHSSDSEDMAEYWFALYRHYGYLDKVKAIIFGEYSCNPQRAFFDKLYSKYVARCDVPVAVVNFFGESINYPIPNGAEVELDLNSKLIKFINR